MPVGALGSVRSSGLLVFAGFWGRAMSFGPLGRCRSESWIFGRGAGRPLRADPGGSDLPTRLHGDEFGKQHARQYRELSCLAPIVGTKALPAIPARL